MKYIIAFSLYAVCLILAIISTDVYKSFAIICGATYALVYWFIIQADKHDKRIKG